MLSVVAPLRGRLQLEHLVGRRPVISIVSPGSMPARLKAVQQLLGLVLVAQHAHRRAHRDGHERHAGLARGVADRVAVRAGGDAHEQRAHALLEVLGDAVLEGVGLLVHLVPGDAEDLHEEGLDQPVARDDARRRAARRLVA